MDPSLLRIRPIGAQCKRAMLSCKAALALVHDGAGALAAFRREHQHEGDITLPPDALATAPNQLHLPQYCVQIERRRLLTRRNCLNTWIWLATIACIP